LKKKIGNFEAADGGTMFFDEIAEMNPETQAKLLRVLEQKSFRRLGGEEEIHVDVRTIGATNKNIQEALRTGSFRQDLYYRFSVIEIQLPPLRDRREDIPLLIDFFLNVFTQRYNRPVRYVNAEAMEHLVNYSWPGNIRELRNIIERIVVISRNDTISASDLPDDIIHGEPESPTINIPLGTTCDAAERQLILRTLAHVKNNKSRAAKVLGVSRKTLHTKLKTFVRGNDATPIASS
jgi:transcriptional regulator with PAS, ATPase and Fis domain